jgi:hypothetical protein
MGAISSLTNRGAKTLTLGTEGDSGFQRRRELPHAPDLVRVHRGEAELQPRALQARCLTRLGVEEISSERAILSLLQGSFKDSQPSGGTR